MSNGALFNAAIVNEEGIIENVLVFNSEEIMHDFGAKRLAPGQGIGDKYISPEEYNTLHKKEILLNEIQMAVDDI